MRLSVRQLSNRPLREHATRRICVSRKESEAEPLSGQVKLVAYGVSEHTVTSRPEARQTFLPTEPVRRYHPVVPVRREAALGPHPLPPRCRCQ